MTGCALIGHGYWGTIIEKYLQGAGFEVLHVYTRSSNISYEQILADENVKAVFICTPASTHYQLVKQAIQAGKHVFCEKMLTADPVKARELYELAGENGKVLFTDYIYQYSPSVRKLVQAFPLLKGDITVQAEISQYGKFYEDCGVMENIGVHMLTVIGMLTGFRRDIEVLEKTFVPGENGNPVEANIRFASKIKVDLKASIISQGKVRKITVLGENGSICFDMMGEKTFVNNIDDCREELTFNEGDNLTTSIAEFAKQIAGNCSYVATYAKQLGENAKPIPEDFSYNKECCLYVEDMIKALR